MLKISSLHEKIFSPMRILIITGGGSSERKISFISAKQVQKALIKKGHEVELFDLKKGNSLLGKKVADFDVVFPVLHGEEGEGGSLHKFLCMFETPIVGTRNYKCLEKGWFKMSFKKFCEENGILTAEWKRIKAKKDILNFGFPCVLKSSNGGSSREVVILKNKEGLNTYSSRKLLRSGLDLFVEKYLTGIEVTVGILNNKALPIIEIIPPEDGWFDYKNKYSGKTGEILFAPSLAKDFQGKIQEIALEIHKKLDLGEYSRIDFIVSENKAYVLEVNTIPGMTQESLLPKAAKAAGIPFEDLCEKLVRLAK